ncbi:MAG: GNAT family N-acetyltransferase [Kineosporiaceae bacterium]
MVQAGRPVGPEVVDVDPEGPLLAPWLRAVRLVFKDTSPVDDALLAHRRKFFVPHRVLAVLDDGEVVGTFRSWDTGLSVPGPGAAAVTVPGTAVSSVTVAPTHRRRGVLTRLMTDHLRDARERGVAAAALIASEGTIYGRYGFGVATQSTKWRIDVPRARAAGIGGPVEGRFRHVDGAALRAVAPEIAEAARRPGTIDRPEPWWDVSLGIDPPRAAGAPPVLNAVLLRDGAPAGASSAPDVEGYVRYEVRERWEGRDIRTEVEVVELEGRTPAATARLWGYVAGLDLVATVVADERPVDEPLPWLLADPRAAASSGPMDFLWVRPLDVAALLSGRGYPACPDGSLTLEVRDRLGLASGTYRLDIAGGTGRCTRADVVPDVVLDVDVLGAACLGERGWLGAALRGKVTEHREGALLRLAGLLQTPSAPWAATGF